MSVDAEQRQRFGFFQAVRPSRWSRLAEINVQRAEDEPPPLCSGTALAQVDPASNGAISDRGGVLKTTKALGVGTGTVHRIKREMAAVAA